MDTEVFSAELAFSMPGFVAEISLELKDGLVFVFFGNTEAGITAEFPETGTKAVLSGSAGMLAGTFFLLVG